MVRFLVALSIATLATFVPAIAEEFGTKAEAIAMVKSVQDEFKTEGPEATFKAVSDPSTKNFTIATSIRSFISGTETKRDFVSLTARGPR